MSESAMEQWSRSDAIVRRYLRLLGVSDRAMPTLVTLRAIVRQHLLRVPFENVSKLLLLAREGAGRPSTITEFLEGIEHHDLGGTCYSSNPFLAGLLAALGYDVGLLGADMATPNVHTAIRVRLSEAEYHIDVGYAAPFSAPIPLDRLPYEVSCGSDQYVFDRCPHGYQMTVYAKGERRHGYLVHPPPRSASYFHPTIVASYEPGRTFMRCLRMTRFFEGGRAVELRNRTLLRISPEKVTETRIGSVDELRRVLDEAFLMPRCPVEVAVAALERLNGQSFFGPASWPDSRD